MLGGIIVGIEPDTMKRNTPLFALGRYEVFIFIRILSAKLKIAVSHRNGEPRLMKQMEHHHRIHSATYGQKNFIGSFAQLFNMSKKWAKHDTNVE
jgi:hypothetical protein